jgi:glycosyltransferase involved in cell wall biosynthesis
MKAICSVIIPCYNQAHFAREALESLRAQTFDDWEAIVVDDASVSGDVAAVVAQFGDPRIRVIRHATNRGLGAARNTGFNDARADLVLPLDADDTLTPTFLEETTAVLQTHPEASCVYTDLQLFGDDDSVWRYSVRTPADMLEQQWIPGPGTLMRRDVWVNVGGYIEVPYQGNEDWDFWLVAVQRGLVPMHIPKPLYRYRRTATSMSVSSMLRNEHRSREIIYRRHRAFFDAYRAGRRFLAEGYARSVEGARLDGRLLRSVLLGMRGLAIAPWYRRLQIQVALTLLPPFMIRLVRAARKRRLSPATGHP